MKSDSVFAFPPKWGNRYAAQVERNIGLLGIADPERLRTTRIAVLGTGGLGGPRALQLVHLGCGDLVLCDRDEVELSKPA
jgi:tRNA A37 threonylcarbamoyladenosine dehydratase